MYDIYSIVNDSGRLIARCQIKPVICISKVCEKNIQKRAGGQAKTHDGEKKRGNADRLRVGVPFI